MNNMKSESQVQELIHQCKYGSIQEKYSAIVDIEEMGAKEAAPEILELLAHSDEGVRANAAHALGKLEYRESIEKLTSSLKDSSSLVRLNAIESLGLLRAAESVEEIVNLLRTDKDPLVRLQAAESLKMFDIPSTLSSLTEALNDPDEGVRAFAADSIGHIGSTTAIPSLIDQFDVEQSLFTRAHILSALYRLGDTSTLVALFDLIETADDTVATTILNLATDLATSQNVDEIKDFMSKIAQRKASLGLEVNDLLKSLDFSH